MKGGLETRRDILIRGLWESQNYTIIVIIFGDSDADTYKNYPMKPLLDWQEKEKKDNHGKHCHE